MKDMTPQEIADTLRYCWNHADTASEEDLIVWVAEKFAERLDPNPHVVNGYVQSITGRRVYARSEAEHPRDEVCICAIGAYCQSPGNAGWTAHADTCPVRTTREGR